MYTCEARCIVRMRACIYIYMLIYIQNIKHVYVHLYICVYMYIHLCIDVYKSTQVCKPVKQDASSECALATWPPRSQLPQQLL